MKIKVDATLCQGHNRCTAIAPSLFILDQDGYATAAGDGAVPAELEQSALLSIDNCPELAISLCD